MAQRYTPAVTLANTNLALTQRRVALFNSIFHPVKDILGAVPLGMDCLADGA